MVSEPFDRLGAAEQVLVYAYERLVHEEEAPKEDLEEMFQSVVADAC